MAMVDREPAAWETNAPGPFLTLPRDRGKVTVWALGEDRFDVVAPGDSHEIAGYDAARALAHVLAEELGPAVGAETS
jgi:hypothetical protein